MRNVRCANHSALTTVELSWMHLPDDFRHTRSTCEQQPHHVGYDCDSKSFRAKQLTDGRQRLFVPWMHGFERCV